MEERVTESVLTLPPPRVSEADAAPLVVAVEATRLAREVRGIGRYVRALLPRLIALRPGLRLELYVKRQRDIDALAPGFTEPQFGGRVSLHRVRNMTRSRADVFWYPWNVASPIPSRGAVVVTMHDVVPIAHPDPRRFRGFQKNLRWRRRYATTAKHATLIIADSQFTADEVHRMLGVPYDRMRVVLLAADDFAVPPAAGDADALARLGVAKPFVLAVGAADRRKNLDLLERAMPRVVAALPDVDLVLAGPRRDPQAALPDAAWRKPVGFVSDEELAALYRSAGVLVMPSTYEGFGLPVLEAMQLGTPVISTRASSLPEVGGDAASYIDPEDEVALAERIIAVMSDPARAAQMRSASLAQSARFSWDETARQTIGAFEEARSLSRK